MGQESSNLSAKLFLAWGPVLLPRVLAQEAGPIKN